MNPVGEDIKDILVAEGIGNFPPTSGWGISMGVEPAKPKTCITIYDTGGVPPSYCFNNSIPPLRRDNFMVRVRAGSYLAAHDKLEEIVGALAQIGNFDVTPTDELRVNYKNIFQNSEMYFMEKDENDGYIWVCNFVAVREEKPVT